MKADEDEDEDTTIGQSHYPCLPSLVALQQMRNRLHMAHDGKRLMKWSAMATGRELRKIAMEINEIFKGFFEDVKNAYILLARCRYFYPNLNTMTTENVSNQAIVTVEKSSKSVTGVRLTQFVVVENGNEPFPFLGIDQGGRAIRDAKDAWLEYLKRLIMILELRTSFQLIEFSNKSATKKSNVLGKIIIPKTELTIRYILAELEELEREEFFRLKKVLEVKYRHKKKKGDQECPLCKAEKEEEAAIKKAAERKKSQRCIACNGPMKSDPNKVVAKDDGKNKADLQDQLDKIIQITKEYEQKGIQPNTLEKFKLMAQQLRDKLKSGDFLPENADPKKLCDACRKRFKVSAPPSVTIVEDVEDKGDGVCDICDKHSVGPMSVEMSLPPPKKQASKQRTPTPSVQSRASPTPSSVKSKTSQKSDTCEKHTPEPDLELGVFETDVKEIVKIVRRRNEDGTVTEEKMVITIKKESKSPAAASQEQPSATSSRATYRSSETSNKSNAYGGNKRVGLLTVPEARRHGFDNVLREVNSNLQHVSSNHVVPLGRYCKSSCSTMSIDSEFAQELKDKMKISESSLSLTISNPYFIKNTIGLVTTAATNRPFHVPREVQSYYLPVPSMMADPVARCCKSTNNVTSIDSIFDVIAEQNKRKPADFTNTPMAVPNDSDKENKEDTEKRLFDKIASQVHSFYLSLHMPSMNTSSTISGIEKLTKQAPVNKVAEIAKVDTTSSIQMPLSETICENEQDNKMIERQYSERTDASKLEETEEKMKCAVEPLEPIKIDELKPKLYEVIEKKINKFQPHRSVNKTNSTKNNLKLGVCETETQDIVKILRKRNNDGTLTEERKVIKIKIETTYSFDTKANNVSNTDQPDTNDEEMVFKSSYASIKSDLYFDSKTVGMAATATLKKQRIIAGPRAVMSHITLPSVSMADNLTRYCDSSTSMISVDNEFEAVCKCLINNSDCNEDISSDLREYVTSSTEFDQLMESFEPTQYTEVASTSKNCKESCESALTNSERTTASDSFMQNEKQSNSE